MGFPRQEYWSGLPFSTPGDLPESGMEPKFSALAGGFFTPEPPKGWAYSNLLNLFLVRMPTYFLPSLTQHHFPGGTVVKNLPTNSGNARSLGQEHPLEEKMANHSSILTWKIP